MSAPVVRSHDETTQTLADHGITKNESSRWQKRRHMDATQRSAVAAELANMQQGQRTDLTPSANLQNVSQTEAATLLNVSPRSVATASKVKDESPEIFAAMKSGDISAHLASQVIDLPQEERAVVEASQPEEMKEVAREAIQPTTPTQNPASASGFLLPESYPSVTPD